MKLTVRTLAQKCIYLTVEPSTSVLNIKQMLSEAEGFDIPAQKLIYSGKILTDDQTIQALGIKEEHFMVIMVHKPKSASSTASAANTPSTTAAEVSSPRPASSSINAAQPSSTPAAAPTPSVPDSDTSTPAAKSDPSFATGTAFETAVSNMVDMGYPRDQVIAAMRAAFNNPDRAFDYLLNGLPANLQQASPAQAAGQPVATEPTSATAPPVDPNNLFSLAQQQVQGQTQSPGGGLSDVANLIQPEQLDQLRAMLQANPAMIQPIIQQLVQTNPQLGAAIQANPQLFLQMLLGGGAPDDDGMVDLDGNPIMPGATVISVTEEEKSAIDRLVALGFDRQMATEAFLLCDKNEELAANFLFENQFD